MALIEFLAGNATINNLAGSGLGFYGSNFGDSVQVGAYQGTTFITNSAGTAQGPAADNIKWLNAQSGYVNSATSGIGLLAMTNAEATLNVRFTHTSTVLVQNAKAYIYDRTSINQPATGVTTKMAEIIHPNATQGPGGSGDNLWHTFSGSAADSGHYMGLVSSPGSGGHYGNGAGDNSSTWHDWYINASCSPDSVGAKLFALYISLEYL